MPATPAAKRRPFRHAGEEVRRAALIAAALDCVAEGGLPKATVREIAVRAGVTQGLIRHYFPSKDDLLAAAYQALMDRLLGEAEAALDAAPGDPVRRLGAFVRAALGPDTTRPAALAAWAGFAGVLHRMPRLRAIHAANYLRFRDHLQRLAAEALAAAGRPAPPAELKAHAIALNALLDGLWLEGGLLPEAFRPGELATLGLAAIGSILDLDLAQPQEGLAP